MPTKRSQGGKASGRTEAVCQTLLPRPISREYHGTVSRGCGAWIYEEICKYTV